MLLSSIASTGCAPGDLDLVAARPPMAADLMSAIIIARAKDGSTEVHASALEGGFHLEATLTFEPDEIWALGYGCALEVYGFAPGLLKLTDLAGRSVPGDPDEVWAAPRTEEDTLGEWVPYAAPPEWVASIRLAGEQPSGCIEIETNEVTIPEAGEPQPHVLVPIDERRVLVGYRNGRFYDVSQDGQISLAFATTSTRAGASAGLLDATGQLWIADALGCLHRGSLSGALEEVACAPVASGSDWAWMDVSPAGDSFELFILYEDRQLFRYDGTTLEVVHQESVLDTINDKGGLVRLGPGEALVAGTRLDAVLRYRDGRMRAEPVPVLELDKPISVSGPPAAGRYVGTNVGFLFERVGQDWVDHSHPVADILRQLIPVGRGLLVGGNHGVLTHLPGDGSICPPAKYSGGDIRRIIPFGNGFVAVSRDDDRGLLVSFVERTDPYGSCRASAMRSP